MAMIFYFPSANAAIPAWCKNLMTNLGSEGPKINESAADIASVQADCQGIIDLNQQVSDARNALHKLVATRDEFEGAAGKRIRDYVKRLKTNPKYTVGLGAVLGIISSVFTEDLVSITVILKAVITGRHIRISFGKMRSLHAVNVYRRIGGTGEFALQGTYPKSPYTDEQPPATAGIPELREYYGMPVVNNKEVGQPSAIVSVTFKG